MQHDGATDLGIYSPRPKPRLGQGDVFRSLWSVSRNTAVAEQTDIVCLAGSKARLRSGGIVAEFEPQVGRPGGA